MFFHGSCVSLSVAVASTSSSESSVERPTAIRLLVAGANPAQSAVPVVGASLILVRRSMAVPRRFSRHSSGGWDLTNT